jgi:hypothetical protein
VGGRHSKRPGPSPTLRSLGPSHQWRHKSRVSLRGPPCAYSVVGTPHGEVRDMKSLVRQDFGSKRILNLFSIVFIKYYKLSSSSSSSDPTNGATQ